MSLLPIQILQLGVVYPLRLRGSAQHAVGWASATPTLSSLSTIVGWLWLAHIDKVPEQGVLLVTILSFNGFCGAMLWDRATALAAIGDGRWLAAVALPANLAAVTVIIYPWHPSSLRVTLMTVGLVMGNLIGLSLVDRSTPPSLVGKAPGSANPPSGWFLAKAISGHSAFALTQGIAATLPVSGVTTFFVISRIVGSVSMSGVSAIIPKHINANSSSPKQGTRLMMVVGGVGAGITTLVVIWAMLSSYIDRGLVALASLWLAATSINLICQRLAARFLSAAAAAVTVAGVFASLGVLALLSRQPNFGLPYLLSSVVLTEILPASSILVLLSMRRASIALLLGTTAIMMLIWVEIL